MFRGDLAEKVSESTGIPKREVDKVLVAAINAVRDELVAGGKVTLVGFGILDVTTRASRQGINPATKQLTTYPAYKSARFRIGRDLKAALNP